MKRILYSAALLWAFGTQAQSSGLDASFAGKGVYTTNGHSIPGYTKLYVTDDDRILMAYTEVDPVTYKNRIFIKRLTANGTGDPTFGNGTGVVSVTYGTYEEAIGIREVVNGKILVAMAPVVYQGNNYSLLQLHPDGTPDSSFNDSGVVHVQYPTNISLNSVSIQADGKILLTGSALQPLTQYYYVLRHNADGTKDMSFGNDGMLFLPVMEPGLHAYAMDTLPDNKILIAGTSLRGMPGGTRRQITLSRFSDNGLDGSFGGGTGSSTFEVPAAYQLSLSAMKILPGGAILLAGKVSYRYEGAAYAWLAKMLPDGGLDMNFGTDGILRLDSLEDEFAVLPVLALQTDGKILISYGEKGGKGILKHTLTRLNADGTPDANFFNAGKLSAIILPDMNYATGIGLQSDGKILLAGRHYNSTTTQGAYVARYWHNMTLGVSESGTPVSLKVFPNPAHDVLTITGTQNTTALHITDITGKVLYHTKPTGNHTTINMALYPPGTYLLRWVTDNGIAGVEKITKI